MACRRVFFFHIFSNSPVTLEATEIIVRRTITESGKSRRSEIGGASRAVRRYARARVRGWGRNNVFRRRHFYRAPSPLHHRPFVVSDALCELHCKISLYSRAMRPLYTMPETFLPSRIFFLWYPPTHSFSFSISFPSSFFSFSLLFFVRRETFSKFIRSCDTTV